MTAAISSKAADGLEVPRGLSQQVCSLGGAKAVRVIEYPDVNVAEHAHEWPVLSLYLMGSCSRFFDGSAVSIAGPCAVLHPPGAFHSSTVGTFGLEQIDIEFDPAWLPLSDPNLLQRVHHWRGGHIGEAATRLAKLWSTGGPGEAGLNSATAEFMQIASVVESPREPSWLWTIAERIAGDSPPATLELAKELNLHPGWLAQAYRFAVGEGLQQTLMRKRVERAAVLLRSSPDSAAEIAVASGFCDQSHMIRCFKRLLGRTPNEIRAEGALAERAALAA